MASLLFLPRITATDFEAFRSLLKHDVGADFKEWSKRHDNRIAEYGIAWTIVEIDVNPSQFKRYCDAKTIPYDGNSLLDFAEAVGRENS